MFDLFIIGLGPSGMSASVYAKRAGMNVFAVDSSMPGGMLLNVKHVDNYLGFHNISGADLALKMFEHFNSLEIPYSIESVKEIVNKDEFKEIKTDKNVYKAKNVLIATGMKRKKFDKLDDSLYLGKGISYCAVCDGVFYKDKDVAVIGDDLAYEDALYLSDIAKNVYFVTNSMVENNVNNIKVINNEVRNINKDDKFNLIFSDSSIFVDGIFVNLGNENDVSFDGLLDIRDEKGKIVVNEFMETKVKGIYAAGDVVRKRLYQVCTAVSEGAIVVDSIKKQQS